ncbi:MAG: dihydrolipoamide acetyltransferase family protein [Ilumatobacteraceae bacterium]|nr:dihydrolipoamide acetyltransferase family protein [Ilumatobacteraceae bacterium]
MTMQVLSMPRLGQTMDAGVVVRLAVEVGDSFATGDLLYVVETEKVEIDVEAKSAGRLARWVAGEGDEVPVGETLAVITAPDESAPSDDDVDRFLAGGSAVADTPSTPAAPSGEHTGPVTSGRGPRAMPRARALAREHGIDLASVTGTGDRGSITSADVERHLAAADTSGAALPPPPPPVPDSMPAAATDEHDEQNDAADDGVEALTGHRRAMFFSMEKSWTTIPHFVESVCIDAGALLDRRRAVTEGRPTITAYLIEALAAACSELPVLHAEIVGAGIRHREYVSVAVATDTEFGLVAPVLRDVGSLDVGEIHTRLQDLAERARTRRLTIDEVTGAGVTLSSLGAHGVEIGTPIIPPGQTAMVFAGAIKERAVVVDGQVVARPTMWLTLAADHRLIDGVTAAKALDAVRTALGDPRR